MQRSTNKRSKDQNFHRQTYVKSDPTLALCLLPHGKYVLTKQWAVLKGEARLFGVVFQLNKLFPIPSSRNGSAPQEKLRLQGVGREDVVQWGLINLPDSQQSDLAGNASPGLKVSQSSALCEVQLQHLLGVPPLRAGLLEATAASG